MAHARGRGAGVWVLALIAACAPGAPGAWRHVQLRKYLIGDGRRQDSGHPVAILWRSAETRDDCEIQMHNAAATVAQSDDPAEEEAARRQVEQAFWAPQIEACGRGNVLALEHNEQVEVMADPGPCGPKLLHVRVARNRDPLSIQESTGCLEPSLVSTEPHEALQQGKWVLVIRLPSDEGHGAHWKAMEPAYDTEAGVREPPPRNEAVRGGAGGRRGGGACDRRRSVRPRRGLRGPRRWWWSVGGLSAA